MEARVLASGSHAIFLHIDAFKNGLQKRLGVLLYILEKANAQQHLLAKSLVMLIPIKTLHGRENLTTDGSIC
jgi:hypothetical protein